MTLRLNAPALALRPVARRRSASRSICRGNMEVHADLSGAGATPHAIVAGLNGTLGVAIANGTVDNRLLGSTLGSVLRDVNALDLVGRGGTSQLQCFAARLDARNGIGTVQTAGADFIAADAWMAAARSIWATETLDLRLRPQGRVAATAVVVPLRVTGSDAGAERRIRCRGRCRRQCRHGGGHGARDCDPAWVPSPACSAAQKLIGRQEGVDCGAALAMARGEAARPRQPAAAPARRTARPASTAATETAQPGQPAEAAVPVKRVLGTRDRRAVGRGLHDPAGRQADAPARAAACCASQAEPLARGDRRRNGRRPAAARAARCRSPTRR